jgi:hypothetical protein
MPKCVDASVRNSEDVTAFIWPGSPKKENSVRKVLRFNGTKIPR